MPVIETKSENKATSRDLQNLQLVTSREKHMAYAEKYSKKLYGEKTTACSL